MRTDRYRFGRISNDLPNASQGATKSRLLGMGFSPTVAVRELEQGIYGLREKIFQVTTLNYSASVHAGVFIDREKKELTIKYFANWYFITFAIVVMANILFTELEHGRDMIKGSIFTAGLGVVFLLFGWLIFAIQRKLYRERLKKTFDVDTKDLI